LADADSRDSTLRDVRMPAVGPVRAWPRRAGQLLLLVIVLLGAFGWLGVHSRTTSSAANGYTLTVTYPQVARSGLDVPFRVVLHRDIGVLPSDVKLAISEDYFRIFETQGFYPEPDSSTNDGTFVYFTFKSPPAATFMFEYDAYVQPASQLGKDATIRAIADGRQVAQVSIHTWLAP
jgi:hypothetical protein